jgi:hypothetical protein
VRAAELWLDVADGALKSALTAPGATGAAVANAQTAADLTRFFGMVLDEAAHGRPRRADGF